MTDTPVKAIADGLSLAVVGSTLASYLPPLAALFSITWTIIRLLETSTVKRWLKRWLGR